MTGPPIQPANWSLRRLGRRARRSPISSVQKATLDTGASGEHYPRHVLRMLRDYLSAVAKKWWADTGFVLTLLGYLALLRLGVDISPLWWLVASMALLAAAQFAVYRDLRDSIPPVTEPEPQLALWALHVASASANGCWLTALMWGDRGDVPWDSSFTQRMIAQILKQLGLIDSKIDIRLTSHFAAITSPKGNGSGSPDIDFEIDGEPATVMCHWRTSADAIDMDWVLQHLEDSFRFLLSPLVNELVRPNGRRLLVLGLSNWPAGGIAAPSLQSASRPYQARTVSGNRVVTPPRSIFTRSDLADANLDFGRRILQDGGFVGFEEELSGAVEGLVEQLWPASEPARRGRR